ncbi:C40 family peptidase [Cohnella sp.]|uniref:C40 family peptidase n=1 Tax=Cohnella sp. TaxID=1883426 RepID=UPI003567A812
MIKKIFLSFLLFGGICSGFLEGEASAYSASKAEAVMNTGKRYLGTPYQFGANYGQTRTFDCSSYVKTVYAKNGVTLPRSSREQSLRGRSVTRSSLKKGDLVFFKSTSGTSRRITHVAIYAGNNKLLHTYGEGGVRYSEFSSYWKGRYVKARRVL